MLSPDQSLETIAESNFKVGNGSDICDTKPLCLVMILIIYFIVPYCLGLPCLLSNRLDYIVFFTMVNGVFISFLRQLCCVVDCSAHVFKPNMCFELRNKCIWEASSRLVQNGVPVASTGQRLSVSNSIIYGLDKIWDRWFPTYIKSKWISNNQISISRHISEIFLARIVCKWRAQNGVQHSICQ